MATGVAFDFVKREERAISVEEAAAVCRDGFSCWIDLEPSDGVEEILRQLGVNPLAIEAALTQPMGGRCDIHADCMHVAIAAPELRGGRIVFAHADLLIGERFLVTLRRGPVEIVDQARKNYSPFFQKFAKSLGFLLFELWEHLIESYRRCLQSIEDEVERLQSLIFGNVDDEIFGHVAQVTHDLLLLRRNLLDDREVLEQMTLRQSSFVSDSARPHLTNMVGTLDRLAGDLTVEREILAETLNLYLGIMSHRTNRVVNRLTAISAIFLPLTFLCGVYGMNFTYLPEKDWRFGYLFFWVLVAAIVGSSLSWMRIKRWI